MKFVENMNTYKNLRNSKLLQFEIFNKILLLISRRRNIFQSLHRSIFSSIPSMFTQNTPQVDNYLIRFCILFDHELWPFVFYSFSWKKPVTKHFGYNFPFSNLLANKTVGIINFNRCLIRWPKRYLQNNEKYV